MIVSLLKHAELHCVPRVVVGVRRMIRVVEHNSPLKHIQPSTLVASSITYIVIAYPVIFSSLRSRSHHCRYHGGISSGNKQICAEHIRRPSLCNASHSSQHRKTAPALAFTFATYSLKASILLPRSETLAHPNVLRPVTTLVRTAVGYYSMAACLDCPPTQDALAR